MGFEFSYRLDARRVVMGFRKIWRAALLTVFVFCMSSEPLRAADEKGTALIEQSYSGGDSWARGLLVQGMTIDGKMKGTMFGRPVKAPAGLHIVGVRVEFSIRPKNVLFEPTKTYADIFEFPVKLFAGRSYTAMGRQSGAHVEVWIMETQSQRAISKVIDITVANCKPFKRCPPATITTRSEL
jgi:hypothetical protein